MISTLRGLYFWPVSISITALCYLLLLSVRAYVLVTGHPKHGRGEHWVATVWGQFVVRAMPGWNVIIEGKENLPGKDTAMVMVANHESMTDIGAIYFLGVQFRWLSKASIFRIPVIGQAMRWSEYVPVTRGQRDSHAKAMADSADRLRKKVPMFYFPEGTRSEDGVIKDFRPGAFRLARDEQVPILPIAIHGAGNLMRKGSWKPGSATVRIRVLPAVPPPAANEQNIDAWIAKVREEIVEAHAALKVRN